MATSGSSGGLLLGIDVGTSSSKGVLTDADGRVVASASVPHDTSTPHPRHFEQDADAVWWADLVALCSRLLAGRRPEQVAAVAVSAIGPCVLPLDERCRPLRPGILYGIDSRASAECEELSARFGMPFSSQSVVPKLLWLQRHEPDVWERTRFIVGAEAYLVLKLTGRSTLDVYMAGSYAPLVSEDGTTWAEGLDDLCPRTLLPELMWSTEVAGDVTAEAARETGLAIGTPVIVGTSDAAAEGTSAGLANPGDLMLMYGTTAFFVLQCDQLPRSSTFWSSRYLEPGTFALTGGTNNLGSVTTWFRDQFAPEERSQERAGGTAAFSALAELAATSPPGANGLLALPYLAGERTPIDDPDARGAILGLTLAHTRADVYRALLEGIAYSIRDNIECLAEEGYQPSRVLAVGGGTQNELLLQLVSDVTGLAQSVPATTIGAALGDALRAGVGIGVFADIPAAAATVRTARQIVPDVTLQRDYDAGFARFRQFYRATKQLAHELPR